MRSREFELVSPICPVETLFSREEVARVLGVNVCILRSAVNVGTLYPQTVDNLNPTGTTTYHNFFDILGYLVKEQLRHPLNGYEAWQDVIDELLDFIAWTFETREDMRAEAPAREVLLSLQAEALEVINSHMELSRQALRATAIKITSAIKHEWMELDARICTFSGVRVQQLELFM